MKLNTCGMAAVALLFVLSAPPSLAGKPDCSLPEFADHPKCTDDGNPDGDDPIYRADFSGALSGAMWTRPGSLNGDEKAINFNSNGPNVVVLELDNAFMNKVFGGDEDLCFPPNSSGSPAEFSGSVHLSEGGSGNEPDRVGYVWLNGFTRSGVSVQYAIDLFDEDATWTGAFPPEGLETQIFRSVTRWETRLTKGKYKDGCESGGLISEEDGFIDIQLQRVVKNPYYN